METGDFFGEIGILNLDGGINRWGTIPSPPNLIHVQAHALCFV